MPTRTLPPRPSLDQLKRQAADLASARAAGDPQACQRLREFHPRFSGMNDAAIAAAPLSWSDALFAIAREYGFASWRRLKLRVEGPPRAGEERPHHERIEDTAFRQAVDLIDDGDAEGLAAHLAAHPGLANRRVAFEGGNYFRNPGLLAFVAENPVRHDALPPNIAGIAAMLIDAGADARAVNQALGLVASGRVARECGVQGALIALLCGAGGDPDEAMQGALTHGEFAAAEALLAAGGRMTLLVAAALGTDKPARGLLPAASADERHLALAYAAQHGQVAVARLLLDAGEDPSRYNPMGAHSHSTPLHQAVWYGHGEMVRLLAERGARRDLRDTLWQGTPLDWADYGGQAEIAAYLRSLGSEAAS
jgi:hypothetical protein